MVVVHKKSHRIARSPTAKALVEVLGGGHYEGWGFFLMKRAVADPIGPLFFERHKFPDHLFEANRFHNLVDAAAAYQGIVMIVG